MWKIRPRWYFLQLKANYNPYKVMWWIPKSILIAYEKKHFIARN